MKFNSINTLKRRFNEVKYNEIYQQSEGDREREREREREELKELSKVVGEKRERDELMMMMMYNIYGSDGNMD